MVIRSMPVARKYMPALREQDQAVVFAVVLARDLQVLDTRRCATISAASKKIQLKKMREADRQ